MGSTLEALTVLVLGVPERGAASDGPFNHQTGQGWVRATTAHQYADAQTKGIPVTLLASESTGALSPTFDAALHTLDKLSRLQTSHDSTVYGIGRASPRTFYTHHLAAISNAIVMADASTVTQFANELAFKLSIGLPF